MQGKHRFITCSAVWLLASVGGANAHQVWIEPDGKAANVYFGEFHLNLRERSPGLLDKFSQPSATHVFAKGEQALKVTKTEQALVAAGNVSESESIVFQEKAYPIFERKSGDHKGARTSWTPAARHVASSTAQSPKLTLDIVPTGKEGEFQLFYKGEPLPKAKIGITALSGWGMETRTDAHGLVQFKMPWRGMYMVQASHDDATPGERNGEKYDLASYGTTLTFVQAKGLPPVPAPAPVKREE